MPSHIHSHLNAHYIPVTVSFYITRSERNSKRVSSSEGALLRGQTFQQTVKAYRESFLNNTVIIKSLNYAGNQKFTRDQLMQK